MNRLNIYFYTKCWDELSRCHSQIYDKDFKDTICVGHTIKAKSESSLPAGHERQTASFRLSLTLKPLHVSW